MTRFSATEVRQKYFNILKSHGKKFVSDPASQPAKTVQDVADVDPTTISHPDDGKDELRRITEAALKVRPRTVIGFEFMKYLGYNGGPDRTYDLFLNRLMEILEDGKLGSSWSTDLARSMEKIPDWGREERRDMVRKISVSNYCTSILTCCSGFKNIVFTGKIKGGYTCQLGRRSI